MEIFINVLLAVIVLKKRLLTKLGTCIAFGIGLLLIYINKSAYIIILLFFVIISLVEYLIKFPMVESRNIKQVLCNSLPAIVFLGFGRYINESKFFLIYTCIMAEALADSLASDVGNRYAKRVYSIFTFKRIKKGISGGVSICGTIAGFAGSTLMALIFALINKGSFLDISQYYVWIISISGGIGMLIDSIIGAVFQKKYFCRICNDFSDSKYCCGIVAELMPVKYKVLSNNKVNLVSGFILGGILTLIL